MQEKRTVLILGGGGFVGGHLVRALQAQFGTSAKIINTSKGANGINGIIPLDITDIDAVRSIFLDHRPTHTINLAGIAAPVEAQRNPELAWELHALAPFRIGAFILNELPDSWFINVSSGLIYGGAAVEFDQVNEKSRLVPLDVYSMTKAAGDMSVGMLAEQGLKCMRLRPFNHTGPEQTASFAVPRFASQLAHIKLGLQDPILKVGNLEAIRDFLDVRDVATAYATLIERSDEIQPGSAYNIASGVGTRMKDILELLISISGEDVVVEVSDTAFRSNDLTRIVGDASSLAIDTAWTPEFTLENTLKDTFDFFLKQSSH